MIPSSLPKAIDSKVNYLYKKSLTERIEMLSTEFQERYFFEFANLKRTSFDQYFPMTQIPQIHTNTFSNILEYKQQYHGQQHKDTKVDHIWHMILLLLFKENQEITITKDANLYRVRRSEKSLIEKQLFPDSFIQKLVHKKNFARAVYVAQGRSLDYGILRNALILNRYAQQRNIKHDLYGFVANV